MAIWMESKDIIVPILTLLLGSLLTFVIQYRLFKNQMKWDEVKINKQFEMDEKKNLKFFQHELQRMELQFAQEQLNNRMSYYNKILKTVNSTVIYYQNPIGEVKFYYGVYSNNIKPILYENLHFLSNNIIKKVNSIDNVIKRIEFFEEEESDDGDFCLLQYEAMIQLIQQEIQIFRNTYLDTDRK